MKRGAKGEKKYIPKRKFSRNQFTDQKDTEYTSTSAKKLLENCNEEVVIDQTAGYRIIDFFMVFSMISDFVICNVCHGKLNFFETSPHGLGFKISVQCNCTSPRFIHSSSLKDNKFYEINRRFVFVMRLLGVGFDGINTFCGLMDISQGFSRNLYYAAVENIHCAAKSVFELFMQKAVQKEKELNAKAGNFPDNYLTISGDGSWPKRGFASLLGVTTIIGIYTKKVLDLVVKSIYCKSCEYLGKKSSTIEYEEWKESHEENCVVNHSGNSEKMEVDGMKEMFQRSQEKYDAKYVNYVGDGDSKTFKAITDLKPYNNIEIKKKECIYYVQKRMGTRLRNAKKINKGIEREGDGKLTNKLITDLTTYYGLSIQRNCDSVEKMEEAIWSTYYHKISTNKNLQHMKCPSGPDSWCSWRRAEASNELATYDHKPPLDPKVAEVLYPIYKDLTDHDLLERCVGGFNQNQNECFNAIIWQITPKHRFTGSKILELAAFMAAAIFNEGYHAILKVMLVMGVKIGPQSHQFANSVDNRRVEVEEKRASLSSMEARIARRMEQVTNDFYEETECVLYGPGIAD